MRRGPGGASDSKISPPAGATGKSQATTPGGEWWWLWCDSGLLDGGCGFDGGLLNGGVGVMVDYWTVCVGVIVNCWTVL